MRLIFAAATGVRAGELHALRWRHINFERREVKVETRVDSYYADWLQYIVRDYTSKTSEFDYLEGKHCVGLIQLFRRPLVTIETKPEDVAAVAAGAIRQVLKRSTEEGRRVVFFGAASLQTPPKGWVPIRSGTGVDAEDEQSPHQIYQGALEAAASSRAHVERYVRLMGDEFESRSFTYGSVERAQQWVSLQHQHQLFPSENHSRVMDAISKEIYVRAEPDRTRTKKPSPKSEWNLG